MPLWRAMRRYPVSWSYASSFMGGIGKSSSDCIKMVPSWVPLGVSLFVGSESMRLNGEGDSLMGCVGCL